MKKERVYLAGPMRGIKDFNFPAFHEAAKYLRSLGLEVFSAAEYEEECFGVGFNKSETGHLWDIKNQAWDFRKAFFKDCEYITLNADAIVCLPGWEKSSGARAEVAIGRTLGLKVLKYPTLEPIDSQSHVEPSRASILPSDAKQRKTYPIASGALDYFPDAIAAIAHLSYVGNGQHNPGTPLHWDRSKSTDEADTMMRHFLQRGSNDSDGIGHTTKMAWRALAILQKELEAQ